MKGVTLPTETVFVMEMSPIKFGLGATEEIAYDAQRLGLGRVLIVTDRIIGELGLPERIRALLAEHGVKAHSSSISRVLSKAGMTYKKSRSTRRSASVRTSGLRAASGSTSASRACARSRTG